MLQHVSKIACMLTVMIFSPRFFHRKTNEIKSISFDIDLVCVDCRCTGV